jgi:alkyldihydroxyacetonephosphate synthase
MDQGYLVETFETVTRWSNVASLHQTVQQAARSALGERSYVMAHISHSYDTGASLYFTVLAGGWSDPLESASRWRAAKVDITQAIVSGGGAVSHHHGVGRDHRAWLPEQVGTIGMDVLRSVKTALDPHGIMNPGALL